MGIFIKLFIVFCQENEDTTATTWGHRHFPYLSVVDDAPKSRLGDAQWRHPTIDGDSLSLDWFCWENFNRKPWFLPSIFWGFPVKILPLSNSMMLCIQRFPQDS